MLFSVTGTIASGKTTFIAALKVSLQATVFEEPVEEWREYFDRLQADFNKDTVYELQAKIYEYYHSVLAHIRENPDDLVLMERCHIENIFCFIIPIASSLGRLESRMVKLINKLLDEYHEILSLTKVNTLYLPILSPEVLVTRTRKRNQPNDKYLDEAFFQNHVEIYKKFMSFTAIEGNVPKIYGDFLPKTLPVLREDDLVRHCFKDCNIDNLWELVYNTKDLSHFLITAINKYELVDELEFMEYLADNTTDFDLCLQHAIEAHCWPTTFLDRLLEEDYGYYELLECEYQAEGELKEKVSAKLSKWH